MLFFFFMCTRASSNLSNKNQTNKHRLIVRWKICKRDDVKKKYIKNVPIMQTYMHHTAYSGIVLLFIHSNIYKIKRNESNIFWYQIASLKKKRVDERIRTSISDSLGDELGWQACREGFCTPAGFELSIPRIPNQRSTIELHLSNFWYTCVFRHK